MNNDRWETVEQLFFDCLQREEAERESFLREATVDDPELYREVTDLLLADRKDARLTSAISAASDSLSDKLAGPKTLPAGTRIGVFEILGVLGEGGMGQVYEAQQLEPVRRPVALKLIQSSMPSPQVVARFDGERQALAMMDHPAIATVFDAGTTADGRPYFAMELVRGIPIDEFLDGRPFSKELLIRLFIDICRGIEHAHQKGVIHRDLKPSNILVTEFDGRPSPKVIDFGIAKATGEFSVATAALTQAGTIVGTPRYMSPEQADSLGQRADTRSDVYTLGTLLYEQLCAEHPLNLTALNSASMTERRAAFEGADIVRPSERARQKGDLQRAKAARGDLDWITLKALELNPERRYRSAGELADDLQRVLDNQPTEAMPPSLIYTFSRFYRRNRLAVGAAMVVALSLAVGITLASTNYLRALSAEREALEKAATAEAVTSFMVGLFNGADPNLGDPASLSARQLVELGLVRLNEDLSEQPVVLARIRGNIGKIYENLGLVEQSTEQLEEAVRLFEAAGDQTVEYAKALAQLAGGQRRQERFDEALITAKKAVALSLRVAGPDSRMAASSYNALAVVYALMAQHQQAIDTMNISVNAWKRAAEGSLGHAEAVYNQSGVHFLAGDQQRGIVLVQEAIELMEALDPQLPQLGDAYVGLGTLLLTERRYDDARAALQNGLAVRQVRRDANHYSIVESHNTLAALELESGNLVAAREHATIALELSVSNSDVSPTMRAVTQETLALISANEGNFVQADEHLERAVRERAHTDPDHPDAVLAEDATAQVSMLRGDPAQARALTERVLQHREPLLGSEHPEIRRLYVRLQALEQESAKP